MFSKRVQGRPARGASAVGPQKIVEGMQEALRNLQTSNITRKDIARFAGVTPALVTYYFPDRQSLIEAATTPIVDGLSRLVKERLTQSVSPYSILFQIIVDILACYSKDVAIVELHISHRRSLSNESTPDGLQDLTLSITAFFDEWLACFPHCFYNGQFLTNALLGICRSVVSHGYAYKVSTAAQHGSELLQSENAKMICRIIMDGVSGSAFHDASQVELRKGMWDGEPSSPASAPMAGSLRSSVLA